MINNIHNTELKFIWVPSEKKLPTGDKYDSSAIYFIEGTRKLHVNGVEFGLSASEAASLSQIAGMQSSVQTLETKVSGLQSTVGDLNTLGSALVTIANNLKEQIDGGNYYPSDSDKYKGPQSAYNLGNIETPSNIIDAINKVYAYASAIDARGGITGLQGDSYITVSEDGSNRTLTFGGTAENITIGTQAVGSSGSQGVYIDGSQSIYTGFQQVNAKLVEHNTKISGLQSTVDGLSGHQSAIDSLSSTVNQNSQDISALQSGKVSITTTAGQQALSGAQGSAMTTTEAIANAIESAYSKLLGNQSNFKNGEDKTLGQLRTLIAGLRSDVGDLQESVSGMDDTESAQKILDIISELKQIDDSDNGEFANTILDRLTPFLSYANTTSADGTQGAQGYYEIDTLENGHVYANTVQGIIDALTTEISNAKNAGVSSGVQSLNSKSGNVTISGNQGITIDDSGANIVISATAGAQTTAALTSSNTYGAQTAAGQTIQTALQDINNKTASAGEQAATAYELAATAEGHATTAGEQAATANELATTAEGHAQDALSQLKWVVIN